MMMTEDEAKTKWCPQARMLAHTSAQDGKGRIWEGGYSYNRDSNREEMYMPTGSKCIGSACMMWRQTDRRGPGPAAESYVPDGETFGDNVPAAPAGSKWFPGAHDEAKKRRPYGLFPMLGYCGLAGKP